MNFDRQGIGHSFPRMKPPLLIIAGLELWKAGYVCFRPIYDAFDVSDDSRTFGDDLSLSEMTHQSLGMRKSDDADPSKKSLILRSQMTLFTLIVSTLSEGKKASMMRPWVFRWKGCQ